MRFRAILLAFVLSGFSSVFAEPDNGKFLPAKEIIVPNHVYFELGGGLNFPLEFFNQGNIAMTSYGGQFFGGAGYNWCGWLFGLEYTHDMWGEGKGEYALMQNFKNNIIEFKLRRVLSKNSIDWLPWWFEIVPGAGIGVNFITTDYYPSKHAKDDGKLSSVKLFQSGANCLFYDVSLEFAFPAVTDTFIPFVGADYNAFYDTSIGGGFAGFGRVYIGVRSYPLGIVNDIQRRRNQRKQQRELERLEKLKKQEEPKEEEPKETEIGDPIARLTITPNEDFTPDGDGKSDVVHLKPQALNLTEEPESWTLTIFDPKGAEFKKWSGTGALPENIDWNGKSESGEVVFSRNTYPAKLSVIPKENDRNRSGKNELTDSGDIKTGILMIEIIPDKKWKIIVNTIHFDADRATFIRIPKEQQEENRETLDSIARQIKNVGKVNVLVEGYANNVSNTAREDREELVPLSQLRAETIQQELANRGLDMKTLSAKGRGGANPLAAWEDRANWWKNRRVEFIVTRDE
ncbi:MAG: OmpA family protein [Treponema sp.]|nr:OmpA family protein [Treponema sp.]